jgi:predicted flap endonuclease-1-like 5' DNA nuclease
MGGKVDCLFLVSPWRELFWIALGGFIFPLLCLAVALGREALWPPPRLVSDPAPTPACGPDEIELVEGIGPQIGALLRDHGIDTFEGVASLTPAQLRLMLLKDPDFSLAQPSTWPFQARLLADGRYGDFGRLITALKGGVPRLENVDGIGEAYARRLRAGGIETVAELQRSSPTRIAGAFAPGDRPRIEAMAPHWIDHARRLHEGDPATLSAFARLGAPDSALARAETAPAAVRAAAQDGGPVVAYWRRENRLRLYCAPLLGLALLVLLLLLALLGVFGDRGQCRPGGSPGRPVIVVPGVPAGTSILVVPVVWPSGPWPPGPWPPGPGPVPGQPCCPTCAPQACAQPCATCPQRTCPPGPVPPGPVPPGPVPPGPAPTCACDGPGCQMEY